MNIIYPPVEKDPPQGTLFVFVISCNGKEYIGHSTSMYWLTTAITKAYGKYCRSTISVDDLYYPVVKEYDKMERPSMSIAVVFQSTNGYELLKHELELLAGVYGTPKCLNKSPMPYIPKTVHAQKGSNWLTQNQYLNFMRLLKKYNIKTEQP